MLPEKLEELLADWRAIEPQQVALADLRRADKYQPRNVRLAPYRDRARLDSASERHIADLALKLTDGRELEPLLVARIGGSLYLIDGHHRMNAYRSEGRQSVPVRVREATEAEALLVSKVVNCDGVKLPMHPEQHREAAWQYLALLTNRGRSELPAGASLRSIGRAFGVGKDTIGSMLRKLPAVSASDYGPDAVDPGTGWPQWKHCKGNTWRDVFADVPEDVRERHKDERRAAKLAQIIDKDGLDAFLRSMRLLEREAISERESISDAADRLAAAFGEVADY